MEKKGTVMFIGGDMSLQRVWEQGIAPTPFRAAYAFTQESANEMMRKRPDGDWIAFVVRAYVPCRGDAYDPFAYKRFNTESLIRSIRETLPDIPVFGNCVMPRPGDENTDWFLETAAKIDGMERAGCRRVTGVFDVVGAILSHFRIPHGAHAVPA